VSVPSLSVVVADDHPVVLRGIISLLSQEEGFTVVASCPDGAEAIKEIRYLKPSIAVLDMNMPNLNGLEVLAATTAAGLSTRIVFLAGSPDDSQIIAAIVGAAYGIV
jgi:two-component system nitrate/nitrite response regulator NarL